MILSTNQTLFKMVYSKFGSTHFDIYIHVMLTSAAIQRWAWVNFVFGIIWFSIRAMQWFKKVSCTIFSYNFFFRTFEQFMSWPKLQIFTVTAKQTFCFFLTSLFDFIFIFIFRSSLVWFRVNVCCYYYLYFIFQLARFLHFFLALRIEFQRNRNFHSRKKLILCYFWKIEKYILYVKRSQ